MFTVITTALHVLQGFTYRYSKSSFNAWSMFLVFVVSLMMKVVRSIYCMTMQKKIASMF